MHPQLSDGRPALYFWVFLLVFVVVFVALADWWLHRHGYAYMTTEFRRAVSTTWGPMLLALWFGAFIGLTAHFLISKP